MIQYLTPENLFSEKVSAIRVAVGVPLDYLSQNDRH